ncbi:hypothetical protein R3P38DRAFT_3359154 [Favolaschia claudopus]|uniref:Uncharacterized protein n=1 Tax=Favolaschia claudopus TaxID=2862362 RepID=A0AAW0B0X9_9AGAR
MTAFGRHLQASESSATVKSFFKVQTSSHSTAAGRRIRTQRNYSSRPQKRSVASDSKASQEADAALRGNASYTRMLMVTSRRLCGPRTTLAVIFTKWDVRVDLKKNSLRIVYDHLNSSVIVRSFRRYFNDLGEHSEPTLWTHNNVVSLMPPCEFIIRDFGFISTAGAVFTTANGGIVWHSADIAASDVTILTLLAWSCHPT